MTGKKQKKENLLSNMRKNLRTIKKNISRNEDKLDNILSNGSNYNQDQAEHFISELELYGNKLRNCTEEITNELSDEDEIEKESEQTQNIIDKLGFKIRSSKKRNLSQPMQQGSLSNHNTKLPTLQLPTFSGNPIEWKHFWQIYENEIDRRSDLTGAQKFCYLKGQLKDEALQIINGLDPSNNNYREAVTLLKSNFDKPYLIRENHLKILFELKCYGENSEELKKFKAKYNCCLRGLQAIGENVNEANFVFVELLKWKLPTKIRDEMKRGSKNTTWTMDEFDTLLDREIELLEANYINKKQISTTKNYQSTTSSFGISSKYKPIVCRLCFQDHKVDNCSKYSSVNEKKDRFKELNLCLNCLSNNHLVSNCESKFSCRNCSEKHHTSICDKNKETVNYTEYSSILFSLQKNLEFGIALPTALIPVNGVKVRSFFDQGSQECLVTKELARKLDLKIISTRKMKIDGFESRGRLKTYNIIEIPINHKEKSININAIEVEDLPSTIHMENSTKTIEYLQSKGYEMADPNIKEDLASKINIIIGANYYYEFVIEQKSVHQVTLLSTPFGMMISGPLPGKVSEEKAKTSCFVLDRTVADLWTLDSIGISAEDIKSEEKKTLETFEETITFENGKYTVKLPWKENMKEKLQQNYQLAKGTLFSTLKKLKQEPELLKAYDNVIREYENRDFIEKIDFPANQQNIIHFLPHHGVKRDSATTPLRVVFNCSAGRPSLNDCLNTGPCLLNDLCQVLLRFRLNEYACIGDISKAFLMIQLDEKDRSATCFLWPKNIHEENSPLDIYRFKVVLFGATSSPFLLNATVAHHLQKFETKTTKEIARNIYVDNVQYNSNSENEMKIFYENSKDIFEKAGMKLCEWETNSNILKEEIIRKSDGRKNPHKDPSILGMKWSVSSDDLRFPDLKISLEEKEFTKRNVLSLSSKLFDPLGFLIPVTIRARKLMQNIWKKKSDWDEIIHDEDLYAEAKSIFEDMNKSTEFSINRCMKIQRKVSIHAFSDASQHAYGSVIYLKSEDREPEFLIAKARVTPINQKDEEMTIPKLELTAASLSARLVKFVLETFKDELDVEDIYFWTDSKVVLSWIKNKKELPKFEKGRVKEICRKSKPDQWNYVPTKENPADILSRGATFEKLLNRNCGGKDQTG